MTDAAKEEKNLLRISDSKQTEGNKVLWFPATYLDTRAALKAVIEEKRAANPDVNPRSIGGFTQGEKKGDSFWFVKGLTDADIEKITAASEADFALGKEGRKARAEELKAAAEASKAEGAEAAKADRAAAVAARNESRVLVGVGEVEVGGEVTKDGAAQTVEFIGAAFEKDGKDVAYAYFGEMGKEMAAKAAEKEAEEEASPSM